VKSRTRWSYHPAVIVSGLAFMGMSGCSAVTSGGLGPAWQWMQDDQLAPSTQAMIVAIAFIAQIGLGAICGAVIIFVRNLLFARPKSGIKEVESVTALPPRDTKSDPPFPPVEWLIRRIDVDEVEKDIEKWDERYRDYSWRPFKARMTDRDELWEFSSPAEYWERLAGRAGVALVRDGRPIAHVVTEMN
jgi:hypothetical protein